MIHFAASFVYKKMKGFKLIFLVEILNISKAIWWKDRTWKTHWIALVC